MIGHDARPWAYVTALGGIAAITAAGLAGERYVTLADLAMVYLVAIMVAAVGGRGPTLLAASAAVLALDFFFVEPRFTLAVKDPRHLVTFAVMFAAGLAISALTTRLRQQEAAAREATLRARTEELRSSLLSAVSHDLRTPLAVITGAATSLRDDADRVGPVARAELLDTIVDEARRLERVLQNLLGITRVETGLAPARAWVPVDELIGSALARVEDTLGASPVTVEAEAELIIPVDPVLFEQVLINLLENAIKHGAAPIRIGARRRGDAVELEVADRGPGVAAGTEGRVFEKFFRGPGARTTGVGLGLAVCRGIVEAHGGTIAVVRADGGGAAFRIVLPAPPPPMPAPPPEPPAARGLEAAP